MRTHLTAVEPEVAIFGADQKERGLWGREWVVPQKGKSKRDNVENLLWVTVALQLLDQSSRYFSHREENNTNMCSHAFSFLLVNPREPQPSSAKLSQPISRKQAAIPFIRVFIQSGFAVSKSRCLFRKSSKPSSSTTSRGLSIACYL